MIYLRLQKNKILCKEIMFLCYSVSQRKKNMYLC